MKKLYGLIGYPLEHSFSERYFAEKFREEGLAEVEYRNFPIENIESLPRLREQHPELAGFNVTMPYKQDVVPYLDELTPEARAAGAVNCIEITAGGKLVGHNADIYGLRLSLRELIGGDRPDALILGTGGAAMAAAYVLDEAGMKYRMVSRGSGKEGALSYCALDGETVASHRLIINATPLGMSPAVDTFPDIPYDAITPQHYLFDMVYNPAETVFLKKGAERGARTMNGYRMLTAQAERSWEIWNGQP